MNLCFLDKMEGEFMKVKCINIREKNPDQIKIGEIYYVNPNTIWDDREDWYCEVYRDVKLSDRVGSLKLSHFTRVE